MASCWRFLNLRFLGFFFFANNSFWGFLHYWLVCPWPSVRPIPADNSRLVKPSWSVAQTEGNKEQLNRREKETRVKQKGAKETKVRKLRGVGLIWVQVQWRPLVGRRHRPDTGTDTSAVQILCIDVFGCKGRDSRRCVKNENR